VRGVTQPFPDAAVRPEDARALGFGAWDLDLATGEFYWSVTTRTLFGVPADEHVTYGSFLALLAVEDRAPVEAAIEHTRNQGTGFDMSFKVPRGGHWIRVLAGVVPDETGQPRHLRGIALDIDQEKRLEGALRLREQHFRSILDTVPDAMIVIDDHGRIQRFSAAAERLFGYRADEAIGRDVEMLMTEADRREDYLAHYRATGERHVIGHIRTFRARRADGVEIPIELSVGEARIDGKRIFTGFVRDISDRVAAEGHMEQLHAEYAQSARRNAMGEMAAALAHELNQPLAAAGNFLGTAEVMLERSDANDPAAEMLGKASAQLVRAGEIIRRLRDFMIGRDVELHVEDLSQIVADAAALAFVGLPPVEASYDIAREARMIFADRVQAQQVLVNILRNAAEAVRELPPELRRIVLVAGPADGDMVELSVLDTGPGFPRKLLENMRVPFLSTKAGRGMGVGLSISRRIVEAHGGRFTARNGPSGGGMVCFTLPLYRAEVGE